MMTSLWMSHSPSADDGTIQETLRRALRDRSLLMLNRAAGSRGRRWHAHQYRDGQYEVEDPIGTGKALTPEFLQQQCIRTLCYPEGAESGDGAELGVIPGSHLYRIPSNGTRTDPMKMPICKQIG